MALLLVSQSIKEYVNFVKDYKYNKDDLWKIIGGLLIVSFFTIYFLFLHNERSAMKNITNDIIKQPKKDDFNIIVNKCYEYPIGSKSDDSENIVIRIEKKK
jgi:hypothetical protein